MKLQKGLSFLTLTLIHSIFLLEPEFVDSTVTSMLFILLFFIPTSQQVKLLLLKILFSLVTINTAFKCNREKEVASLRKNI
jgi:hypothetical protein